MVDQAVQSRYSVRAQRRAEAPSHGRWLTKDDGVHCPIGIATLEDKIVQQALAWVLEAIYEEDAPGFS